VRGFKRLGKESWRRHVTDVVKRLKNALSGGAREKEAVPLPLSNAWAFFGANGDIAHKI
jgi:hypothetical protein